MYLDDFVALFLVWLGFAAVVAVFVFRVSRLLAQQRQMERAYRHQLAIAVGRAVRESGEPPA